ncbi:MAG TPA: sensor domain-containing diguanylate cyclase [Bacteroidota bacterium]|nr:sensor domain-containing diguanylate cyclase [Bacteroidota bacterium]
MPPNSPPTQSPVNRDEYVLAGMGVLLIFVGLWSGYRLLAALALMGLIAVSINVVRRYRTGLNRVEEHQHTQDDDNTVSTKKILLFDDAGYGGSIQIDEQHREDEAYATLKNSMLTPGRPGAQEEPHMVAVRKPGAERRNAQHNFSALDFADSNDARSKQEPHNEFNYLLNRTLRVIKEICFAHTVAFFWINRETQHLVLECKATDSDAFITDRKIGIGSDVVSGVAREGQPALLNHIAQGAERDMVRYYTREQGLKSFIAVPVFYASDTSALAPIAVIAIDSKADDAYGSETFRMLTHFTKLLSSLLQSYTEKYDLASDMKTMDADRCVRSVAASHTGISAIVNAFMEEASNLVPWDTMTTVLFDESQRKWVIASARTRGNERFVMAKQPIEFASTVTGTTIASNRVQSFPDVSTGTRRYFHEHEQGMDFTTAGSFVAVPLASAEKSFGAVTFSSRTKQSYGKKEIASLQYLAATLVMALDAEDLRVMVRNHMMTDPQTGTGTRKYFLQRLNEEVERAKDTGDDLSVILVALSPTNDLRQRFGDDGVEAALQSVASVLRSGVRVYDVVARYEDGIFGVLLDDTAANDGFLWAEKIRAKIAGNVITTEDKNFSVTVTISICGVTDDLSARDCLAHAEKVMRQAQAAGGNIVRVY